MQRQRLIVTAQQAVCLPHPKQSSAEQTGAPLPTQEAGLAPAPAVPPPYIQAQQNRQEHSTQAAHLVIEEAELALQRLLFQLRLPLLLVAVELGAEDVAHAAVLGAQVARVVLLGLHLQGAGRSLVWSTAGPCKLFCLLGSSSKGQCKVPQGPAGRSSSRRQASALLSTGGGVPYVADMQAATAEQRGTPRHSTSQHSAAQHGGARRGTPQHGTARHSTARRSTAHQAGDAPRDRDAQSGHFRDLARVVGHEPDRLDAHLLQDVGHCGGHLMQGWLRLGACRSGPYPGRKQASKQASKQAGGKQAGRQAGRQASKHCTAPPTVVTQAAASPAHQRMESLAHQRTCRVLPAVIRQAQRSVGIHRVQPLLLQREAKTERFAWRRRSTLHGED